MSDHADTTRETLEISYVAAVSQRDRYRDKCDALVARRDALENALRAIEAEEGYGESPAPIIVRAVREIARAALAATDTTPESALERLDRYTLLDATVCACLDETGERKVRLYERCERCGTFMPAGERQET